MRADDSEALSWAEHNNRYLAASLQWLRLRLRALAGPAVPAPPQTGPGDGFTPEEPPSWLRWLPTFGGRNDLPIAMPALAGPTLQDQIAQAAQEREDAAAASPSPPALLMLAERFGLSVFERDVLLLCAAVELDPAIGPLCAEAQGMAARSYPTFALALQVFEAPAWEALAAHRPLRYARLLEISQPGATPLTGAALRADERVVNYFKGLNVLDERLAVLLTPVADSIPLSASQQECAEDGLRRLRIAAAEQQSPVALLLGRDAPSRLAVARELAALLERRLYRLGADALPSAKSELELLARLWQRESLLLPVSLYLDADALDGSAHGEQAAALAYFVSRQPGLLLIGAREPDARLGGAAVSVDVPLPQADEQRAAWQDLLDRHMPPEQAYEAAQRLAGHFQLNLGEVQQAAALAAQDRGEDGAASVERVWDECRDLALQRLDSLAQRLQPKASWDDLVVGEEPLKLLRQIAAQVRARHRVYEQWGFAQRMNRGFGISALFSGESGTGKTMAAEVIANDLRLHLYRIDLSAVVSKYIGETEKNLRKLFDAAEAGGAILFFDEADALFGKRSEVKDSHDRYANIEINYLLQRMEAFSGLAILATNMKSALDTAFLRRLRFVVQFPYPALAERRQLWEKALPPELPRLGIDYDRLARFSLSGGNIHGIVLNAAFIAAQQNQPLSMPALLAATRMELRKLEKPVNEAEFR